MFLGYTVKFPVRLFSESIPCGTVLVFGEFQIVQISTLEIEMRSSCSRKIRAACKLSCKISAALVAV